MGEIMKLKDHVSVESARGFECLTCPDCGHGWMHQRDATIDHETHPAYPHVSIKYECEYCLETNKLGLIQEKGRERIYWVDEDVDSV